jgi:hypothetical protein
MRALVLVLGLAIAVAGCGSSSRGPEAAELVPPDALAFASIDTQNPEAWKTVFDLTGRFIPGAGKETSHALLGVEDGEPELLVLVQSDDERELREFVSFLSQERAKYRVQKVGGWSVVADSEEGFAAARAAESGRSLADVEAFKQAMIEVDSDALVTAYANGARLKDVPGELSALARIMGSPHWVGTNVVADENAVQLDARTDATTLVYRPRLLRDVPSGALLAISFKNGDQLLRRITAEPSLRQALGEYRPLLVDLMPAARGEGIFYVQQGVLVPTMVLVVESPTPARAAAALRRLARTLNAETNGFLSFRVAIRGNRVLLMNGAGWPASPTRRLVDDQTFKDALAAADAPDEVSWLAYADIHRLTPIIRALSQVLGGMPPSEEEMRRLERLGTLVAFGARSRLVARITIR